MSLIPSVFGRRSNSVFDPFSVDSWDPFEGWPFNSNFRQLSDNLRSNFPSASSSSETSAFAHAMVDWRETPNAHVFKADVPGLRKEEVKVELEDDRILQISGERKREMEEKGDTWHRVERSSGRFMRRFRLPENAKVEEVKASMENGVLTVTVPKVEAKKPEIKSIDITG
ncbi:17.5 kDa class I heat shock protein-like [Sesamum indicum]|uniref:17.5 kDa class I heat shock protein-like n=1 Tax=Sesamum indicum TaxID=4182 RepID=A0A6I9THJ9_SESIN|nr:17.5 kDa class I heat shock protein-like [Sesamum indicum]